MKNKRIEGVGGSVANMGRVRGVPFRRRRSYILGEASVAVLIHQPGLTSRQISDRLNGVLKQYRFNNSTLGWIVSRTPGVDYIKGTNGNVNLYFVEHGRSPDLPLKTQDRLLKHLEKFHPPTGDEGN